MTDLKDEMRVRLDAAADIQGAIDRLSTIDASTTLAKVSADLVRLRDALYPDRIVVNDRSKARKLKPIGQLAAGQRPRCDRGCGSTVSIERTSNGLSYCRSCEIAVDEKIEAARALDRAFSGVAYARDQSAEEFEYALRNLLEAWDARQH